MGDDIAHAAHFSKGEFRNGPAGRLTHVRRGLTNDLDAPDNGVLFLDVCAESRLARVFDVGGNKPSRLQDVTKPAELISFHTSTRRWP